MFQALGSGSVSQIEVFEAELSRAKGAQTKDLQSSKDPAPRSNLLRATAPSHTWSRPHT